MIKYRSIARKPPKKHQQLKFRKNIAEFFGGTDNVPPKYNEILRRHYVEIPDYFQKAALTASMAFEATKFETELRNQIGGHSKRFYGKWKKEHHGEEDPFEELIFAKGPDENKKKEEKRKGKKKIREKEKR